MSYLNSLGKIRISILFLIIANTIWGASFPIYKSTISEIPPVTFVFLRFYIAALVLLPFIYKNLSIEKKDVKDLVLRSIVGISILDLLLIFGLKFSSSINAPIILSSQPIILIIAAYFFLKEKLKIKLLSGTVISLLGVLTIVILPLFQKGMDSSVTGNLLLVLTSICGVADVLLLKKILNKYSTLTITFWSFLIGSLPLIPFCYIELIQTHWISHLDLGGILGITYAIIFATVIGHTLSNYGIKNIQAGEVGIFAYVDPIATIIVALPLLHETITVPYLIGSILVFLGIFIAEGRIHYHPFHKLFQN